METTLPGFIIGSGIITLSNIQIGALSSLVAELLKFIPALKKNALTSSLTALAVALLGTWFFVGFSMENFLGVIISSLATYKVLIQPIASVSGLKTQEKSI